MDIVWLLTEVDVVLEREFVNSKIPTAVKACSLSRNPNHVEYDYEDKFWFRIRPTQFPVISHHKILLFQSFLVMQTSMTTTEQTTRKL